MKAIGAAGASFGLLGGANPVSAATVSVGKGSYQTTVPSGESTPPSTTYVTSNVSAPLPTNDWWSSLLFEAQSQPLYAHPVSAQAVSGGLDVWNPSDWTYSTGDHPDSVAMMDSTTDLTIGHSGTSSFSDARVDGYGDWHVVSKWGDGTSTTLRTTLAQGSPYVFCEYAGGDAVLTFPSAPTVFADNGNVLGIEVNGHAYGLYAPGDATWTGQGSSELTSGLGSSNYLTVAALPEATSTALSDFEQYAYNFVTDTTISWTYDEAGGEVTTTFDFTLSQKPESSATGTLTGLLPHQHKYTSESFTGYTYASARGTIKTVSGVGSFTTSYSFPGVLPFLPDEGTYDKTELASYVDEEEANSTIIEEGPDRPGDGTYWSGKNYGRLAELIPIAEQVGDTAAADYFLNGDNSTPGMKDDLEIWLDANQSGSTKSEDVFYYDSNWGTLIGYNDSFGSGADLNDHHFHYGYYVRGAGEVARHDSTWAQDSNWGGMVDLLVRDFANWERPNKSNAMDPASNPKDSFPFLRNFSPYEGHSWASGTAASGDGNNQESSSEAINAYASMLFWAEYTGNTAMRDAAAYLYITEVRAIQEYWLDVDGTNLPSNWPYDYACQVWGNGYKYGTYWTGDVEAIHGINYVPVSAHMEYLGWDTDYATSNYNELVNNDADGDAFSYWPDIMWEFRALSDVTDAKNKWTANKDSYSIEFGESRAHTYHWIYNIDGMGTADPSITADHSMTAVYDDGSSKTHVAYNPTSSSITVNFSDGVSLDVPANSMATDGSSSGGGGSSSAPTVDSLSASEVETSDSDAEFDVAWGVGDSDGDLSTVDLTLVDDSDGTTEDTASINVSGSSASGTTRLVAAGDDGSGNSYTVDLTVTDSNSNATSGSTSVAETESTNAAPSASIDSITDNSNPGWNRFDVAWSAGDSDGNLDSVVVELLASNGTVLDSVTNGVSGSSASGSNSLRSKSTVSDIVVRATDTAGASGSDSQSV